MSTATGKNADDAFAMELVIGDYDGIRAAFFLPVIPEDAPDLVKEGVARRRKAALDGECPCGARRPALSRQRRRCIERGRFHGTISGMVSEIHHEPECPAADDVLVPLARRWLKWDATDDPDA